jgi:polar amino acid transport system substrate-binding protein
LYEPHGENPYRRVINPKKKKTNKEKKMKRYINIIPWCLVLCISLLFAGPVEARDLKGSLAKLPLLAESEEKGLLIDLVKAMDEIYTEGTISIEVYPSRRSLDNLVNGPYDFFMPIVRNENANPSDLPFSFSEYPIFRVIFALYSNKNNKEINPGNAGNFQIETEAPLVDYYGFKANPSVSTESSLKKVDIGRIDGYIMAMPETDGVLKQLNLKNIKRSYFDTFDVPFVVKKGQEGKEVEEILTSLLIQLKENGTYAKIMAPMLNQEFVEW